MRWIDVNKEGKYLYYVPSFQSENGKQIEEWCEIVEVVQVSEDEFGVQFPNSTKGIINLFNDDDYNDIQLFLIE